MKVIGHSRIIKTAYGGVHPQAVWTDDGRAWAVSIKIPLFGLGEELHDYSPKRWWSLCSPLHEYEPLTSLHKFLQGYSDEH